MTTWVKLGKVIFVWVRLGEVNLGKVGKVWVRLSLVWIV